MDDAVVPVDRSYLDTRRPLQERVSCLVSQLTLREKIAQLMHGAPPVPRLDIPAYNWWSECLHGVARAGRATVFPQAIGLAATFDVPLMSRIATAISDEGRAKHHDALRRGNRGICQGLTFWSPNINIFRDPRWGRGQETFGEDPYLTARMGVAFVKGLQGDDPKHLKTVATPKHYAVHSGPEAGRHSFDARVNPRDLRETYLPAFKACVTEGGAYSVMGAYNRTNGEPCNASPTLLGKILRGEWGFLGYVVSDCGAVEDIHQHHKVADSAPAAAAMAVREGCDLCCGEIYRNLLDAVQQGLITEAEITLAVTRLFTARFKLGMFDPEDEVRWSAIPPEVVGCEAHRDLALQSARKSMVLLKNNGVLPLSREKGNIGVFGPTALDSIVLLGNYNGYAPALTTILEGIVAKAPPGVNVVYGKACELAGKAPISGGLGWWASECSVVVAVVGNNAEIEGEEGDAYNAEAGGDRVRLGLPGRQQEFLETLKRMGKPLVVVLTTGSAVDLCWAEENADAIVCAWYPGEAGGRAVADVLFGDYNPGGKLPVTFVQSVEQLPPFTDYAMKGRTYRFLETPPLYRFGFGLSFTTFATRDLKLGKATVRSDEPQEVSVTVANTGARAGDEVVQVYLQDVQASVPAPRWQLVAFERVNLKAGEERTLRFRIGPDQMVAYSDEGVPFVEPGEFRVYVGGGQPDDPRAGCQSATFRVVA